MPFLAVTITDGQVSGVDNLSAAASSVVNWELDEAGINKVRPPLTSYTVTNIGSSAMVGAERWSSYTIWVSEDRYVRSIPSSAPTFAGVHSTASTATQIEGSSSRVTFVAGRDYVYIAGGGRIQRWQPSLVSSEVMSSSPGCTHIASLGQRLIANSTGSPHTFRWSDIGEGAWGTWPAANETAADARPDVVVGIFENTNELFVMGESTTQVYGVGSDPTLPFDLVATINTGLAAPYACCRVDGNFALLDDRRRIVMTDGRTVTPISDAIQSDIRGLDTISDCWMFHEERGQQSSVVVRFPTEARTFVYSIKSQAWSERKYYDATAQADFPVGAYVYWPELNYHLFGSTLDGVGLLKFEASEGDEIDGPLVAERTTGWHDHGTDNRKRSLRLRVTMRRGTGTVNTTPGALEVRTQDDDGPWTQWNQISVGEPHEFESVRDIFVGGIFRRRRYGLRYSNTEEFSLVKVADEIQELRA